MREFQSEKEWEHAGLPCVVLMTSMGHRCGYVGVPEGHRLFKVGYDDAKTADGEYIEVHGGLTYADLGDHGYPSSKENAFWWFGYDCAHYRDGADMEWLAEHNPKLYQIKKENPFGSEDSVRSLSYCVAECESLANQLASAKQEATP